MESLNEAARVEPGADPTNLLSPFQLGRRHSVLQVTLRLPKLLQIPGLRNLRGNFVDQSRTSFLHPCTRNQNVTQALVSLDNHHDVGMVAEPELRMVGPLQIIHLHEVEGAVGESPLR